MDFAKSFSGNDIFREALLTYQLALRDLGSSQQVAWDPCRTEHADEVEPVVESLFEQHGAPLVLKSDNGSAFIAELFKEQLAGHDVAQLRSPPRTPSYNGVLERANGTLKTYTQLRTKREGHALRWTTEGLEQARILANEVTRPQGADGPTPDEAWKTRQPITQEERRAFCASLAKHREHFMDVLGVVADEHRRVGSSDMARVDHHAIRSALVEGGYLILHRVRRAPKKPKRLATVELNEAAEKYLGRASPSVGRASPHAQNKLAVRTAGGTIRACPSSSEPRRRKTKDARWSIYPRTRRRIPPPKPVAKAFIFMRV